MLAHKHGVRRCKKVKKITILISVVCMLCVLMIGCGNEAEKLSQSKVSSAGSSVQTSAETNVQDDISESFDTPDSSQEETESENGNMNNGKSVDLTILSSTMVYSEVYNMMVTPEDYVGGTVKMKGQFAVYEDTNNNKNYYAVVIADATACCQQGLEFVLDGDYQYPNDYPEQGAEITVTGTFQTYEEDGNKYCHLVDGKMEIN